MVRGVSTARPTPVVKIIITNYHTQQLTLTTDVVTEGKAAFLEGMAYQHFVVWHTR